MRENRITLQNAEWEALQGSEGSDSSQDISSEHWRYEDVSCPIPDAEESRGFAYIAMLLGGARGRQVREGGRGLKEIVLATGCVKIG